MLRLWDRYLHRKISSVGTLQCSIRIARTLLKICFNAQVPEYEWPEAVWKVLGQIVGMPALFATIELFIVAIPWS